MKIGIDISSIIYGTGVSKYTKNLVESLAKYHNEHDYTLFGGSLRSRGDLVKFSKTLPKKQKNKFLPLPPNIQAFLFNQLRFSIDTFTNNLDIFHCWDWYTPGKGKTKLVTTVHDLSAIKFENQTHPEIVRKHKDSLKAIKKQNIQVIAVSESTKNDLVNLMGFNTSNITVIHEAMPEEDKIKPTKKDLDLVSNKFNIKKPYFISIASQEPRKNISRIITAYKNFKNDFNLVLVGKKGFDQIKEERGVIQTGYVSDQDLAALIKGSQALLYPSLYEGFGLPMLMGFFHQTPVVTSNISSMPEVAGSAAVLVDPKSTQSIVAGIKKAMENKPSLIKKGSQQLKKYNWKKVANQTIKVYQKAYEKK